MMRTTFILVVAVLAVWPTLGHAEPVNRFCPVMTEEKIDPAITAIHRGQTIAFCCDRCLAKFKAEPEKYAARLSQMASLHGDPQDSAGGNAADSHDNGPEHGSADQHDFASAHSHSDKEHGHGEGGTSGSSAPLAGRLHPVIVHFPIAGVPLALLGFLVWLIGGRESFAKADIAPLAVAAGAAVIAVITGNVAHDSMRFSPAMHEIVEAHQLVATAVMVMLLVLSALRLWRWNRLTGAWRWAYGAGLFVTFSLLGLTGYLGGSLVFGPDHFKW